MTSLFNTVRTVHATLTNPQKTLLGMSQAGFDGGLDSRILSSGEETLRRHGPSTEVPA